MLDRIMNNHVFLLPRGRPRFLDLRLCNFSDVPMRTAPILKNHIVLYLLNALHVAEHVYLPGFERHEYARIVSFGDWCRVH